MKISKLFHWLYASLMLLPIFSILATTLYVSFNPNAKDSYFGDTINQKEVISNITINDLVVNNVYYLQNTTYNTASINMGGSAVYLMVENVYIPNVDTTNITRACIYVRENTTYATIYWRDNDNSQIGYLDTNLINNSLNIHFTYLGYYDGQNNINNVLPYISPKTFIFNDYSFLDNNVYFSVYQVSQQSLFNWANNSFLAEPITYISGIFGVPSTSPLITMLSYWLAISVIWLVFDLIMYIPLLAHRWIDKGVLE